ncbi:MAG: DMT family transporter [Bdellovibrionales bacterium]
MSQLTPRALGVLQVILAGVCFGFLGVFGRGAFEVGLQATELLGFRFLLASLLTAALCGWRLGPRSLRVSRKELFHFALLGLLGYAVFSSFYFLSLQRLSITLAVLLLYTFPIWVTLGGALFFRDRLTWRQLTSVPLALVGLTLLIGLDFQIQQITGLVYGLTAAITYAAYILLSGPWLRGRNPFVAILYIQLFAGLALFAAGFQSWTRALQVLQLGWPMILGLAIVCSVLAMSLFQAGLQKIKPWEAALLSMSEPVVGIALASLIFQEQLSALQILGAVLVLLAFVGVSRAKSPSSSRST